MKYNIIICMFLSCSGFAQHAMFFHSASSASGTPVRTLVGDGVQTWFNDPRAYWDTVSNQLLVGYVSSGGSIGITSYPSYENSSELRNIEIDDHNNPSIIRKSDGKYLIGYSTHNGYAWVRESTNVGDIKEWAAETELTGTRSYVYLHELPNEGRIMYFYRDFDTDYHRRYQSSTDGGITWDTPIEFFDSTGHRPYVISRQRDADRIDFFATNGNPNAMLASLYHWYYQDSSWYQTDGTYIAPSTTTLRPWMVNKMHDSSIDSKDAYNWDMRFTTEGYPVCVWVKLQPATQMVYYYSKWNGSAWEEYVVGNAGNTIAPGAQIQYAGGITILDENTLFYSSEDGGNYSIYKATTTNGGFNWSSTKIIEGTGASDKNCRPFVPINTTAASSINLTWINGYYSDYVDYLCRIKIGKK